MQSTNIDRSKQAQAIPAAPRVAALMIRFTGEGDSVRRAGASQVHAI
jgi:hypothetical protein